MTTVIINGRSMTINGSGSIQISHSNKGHIIINGQEITSADDEKIINIVVQGNIGDLNVDSCSKIDVQGTAESINTGSGSIQCQDVDGDVETGSGSIKCNNIAGKASTGSGSIKANNIGGKASTGSGNIYKNGEKS